MKKSWYFLVGYTWMHGKWITFDLGDDFNLMANDEDGTSISIKWHCYTEAAEILGI